MNRDELIKYISYSPETGEAHWKLRKGRRKAGDPVGSKSHDGYMYFGFNNKTCKLHRAIYLMVHGELPRYIDHINGNRLDNRITNLRAATITENNRNMVRQSNNKSGVTGVSWSKDRQKWCAMIWHNSKPIPLGRFVNKEDAVKARKEAEVKYGYHPNHGR